MTKIGPLERNLSRSVKGKLVLEKILLGKPQKMAMRERQRGRRGIVGKKEERRRVTVFTQILVVRLRGLGKSEERSLKRA